MADYKELLGSLMNRARDVMEQTGVAGVYQKGVDRTRSYSRMAKLSLDMNSQSEELRKVYTEIGKLYFDQAQDDPQGFFAPLFAQAKALRQDLLDKQTELRGMGLWAIRLQFTTENPLEVDSVLAGLRGGAVFDPGPCTRGLAYRGVE
jgi:hypothetical protein